MTLNSLDNQPDKLVSEVTDLKHNNCRGSNFQNQNAFDETLQESPIRKRFDADGTTFIEKGLLMGVTQDEAQMVKVTNQLNTDLHQIRSDERSGAEFDSSYQIDRTEDANGQEPSEEPSNDRGFSAPESTDKSEKQGSYQYYNTKQLFKKKTYHVSTLKDEHISSKQTNMQAMQQRDDSDNQCMTAGSESAIIDEENEREDLKERRASDLARNV